MPSDLLVVDEAWFTATEKISILAELLERLTSEGADEHELVRIHRMSAAEMDVLIRLEATTRTAAPARPRAAVA